MSLRPSRPNLVALAFLLPLGCHPQASGSTTPQSSAPKPPEPAHRASFVPAEGVLPLELACRDQERPKADGLDDDCDGHIDGDTSETAYSIAVSAPPEVASAVCLRSTESAQAQERCVDPTSATTAAFQVFRLAGPLPASGTYQLQVNRAGGPPYATGAVAIAVSLEGATEHYAARLEGQPEQAVGIVNIQ